MKKLLIFDLDGTLLNTLDDLANAVNHALTVFGYENKSKEFVRKAIGNGVAVLISRCIENGMDNPNYKDVLSTFRKHYFSHYLDNTIPYENMLHTLTNLKKHGYKLAVVSNKIHEVTSNLITHYFPGIFDMIQGDVPTLNKKPNPDMVNRVLNELKIGNDEACYIGDTNVDYETAKNSNIDVLLVTYGYRTKEEMKEYHFDCPTVDSVLDIEHYFIRK